MNFDHPVFGPVKTLGYPVQYSQTPTRIVSAVPELGQHTEKEGAQMVVVGIDVGSKTVKVVLLARDRIVSHSIVAAGIDLKDSCEQALGEALEKAKLSAKDVVHITATGTGKTAIPVVDDDL